MAGIYTRTGDGGETGLPGDRRVRKDHPQVAACGELDELNSSIGAAISVLPRRRAFWSLRMSLEAAQRDVLAACAELAAQGGPAAGRSFPPDGASRLEAEIDRLSSDLPPLREFLLPGGSAPGAFLHVARAVCRRAERAVCALGPDQAPPAVLSYLNRLSDFLYVAARWANRKLKQNEVRWRAPR